MIFNEKETLTLNRFDLINSKYDLENFIFKTLMWGYPTKGRGKNIENMLENGNLERLIKILENYRESEISNEQLNRYSGEVDPCNGDIDPSIESIGC